MLQTKQSELKIKIAIVGEVNTGKTNIKNRLCRGSFAQFSNPTIGAQLAERKFWAPFNEKQTLFSLVCWDIGAKTHDQSMLPSFFRNALGIIYVYDVTKKQTFEQLESWRETVVKYMNTQHYTQMIIGNKTDLLHFKQVQTEEVQKWAVMKRIHLFYETSALQNLYIEEAAQNLVLSIVQKFDDSLRKPLKIDRKQVSHRGCI